VSDIIDEFSNFIFDFSVDMETIIDEALTYDKINESKILISKEVLSKVLI